ncbi:diacylglycerol/lipid kinase family protein [Georgenia thermotolerans]|uniref:Diacylglycerol kinase n=1 Tax=Georgenia thermotolerans TaxID=527326 RepID=A0A7J5ULH7_9MICO|nr:diacylglycerol kinase family protein [Georgenia thermotolerans]KAE8763212.1 diacylglycerol kinase [Georgenia thermotolerans]
MTWEAWVAVAALVLALVAVVLGLATWRAVRRRTPSFAEPGPPEKAADEPRGGPPAVVFNPSKGADARTVRALVAQTATDVGMDEPLWFETTVEDPGLGQTREALERGASVVIAAGGDGTVRAVAEGLAGTGVPMGLLPLGTGNLFARNLDLPLTSQREMVATALTGRNRTVDLGWLRTEPLTAAEAREVRGREDASTARSAERTESGQAAKGRYLDPAHPEDAGTLEEAGAVPPDTPAAPEDPDKEHVFLVIGGLGFDAAMVAGADEELKARLGWIAYFVAGVKHLAGRKIRASVELGASEQSETITARTILFANVGRLPGGVVLFPDAQIDDGYLDIAVIDTRGGLIGWADLLRKVTLQGLGVRKDLLPYSTGSIRFRRAQELVVRTEEPEHVQVDGDLVGFATTIYVRAEKGGLVVRTA